MVMENSKVFLNSLKNTFTQAGMELIVEFFITFSRFECALKNSITYADGVDMGKVNPAWDRFANAIAPTFDKKKTPELEQAVDYILAQPPMQQIIDRGGHRLTWAARPQDPNQTIELGLCLRAIRNNLFHGGKFQGEMIPEVSRNHILLLSCLTIMNEWLTLEPNVERLFLEEVR